MPQARPFQSEQIGHIAGVVLNVSGGCETIVTPSLGTVSGIGEQTISCDQDGGR